MSVVLAIPGRLYRWCKKWLVHIWLGLPLLVAFTWMYLAPSDLADVYAAATSTPSFWQEGIITRPDLKGRQLRLRMADGTKRRIFCKPVG